MSWLVPRNKLDSDSQLSVVRLPSNQNYIFKGSPGSGKTVVMLHRAKQLLESREDGSGRLLILVYTRVLKDYIKSAVQDLKLSENSVSTLDGWCKKYYRTHIRKPLPQKADENSPDFERIREEVSKHIGEYGYRNPFDFIMVDEGQDIDKFGYRIIASIAKHATVFMDHKQCIYADGCGFEKVKETLGASSKNLLPAFRCSPFIVRIAAEFISNERERKNWLAQNPPIDKGERQNPVLYLAKDHDDEMKQLMDAIRTRINKNERIAILFPSKRHAFGLAKRLRKDGLEVEDPGWDSLNFETMVPKALAYPSAKGLTFDSVFMPMLEEVKFPNFVTESDLLEKWLFVGISRAVKWVHISSRTGECCFIDRFERLESEGQLTILKFNQTKTESSGIDSATDAEDELDDFY